jgi:RNA recognition motif-containing protein
VWGSKGKVKKGNSYTTIVIKNLPEKCTNALVLELLNKSGFEAQYDFVYVPTDFRNYSAFGYAFVNLVSHQMAELVIEQLDGVVAWNQTAPLDVDWSMPHQGYAVHVRRYQNSPVMHTAVPQEYKPMIFRHGVQQKFPEPTKKIKEPRLRRGVVAGTA